MNKYHFSHLENYTTFNSVEELNHHVNNFRDKTTETEFKVLWFISRYAVKFIGAAHLKLATIADGIGMSIKTVQRALKSLVELEAINKVKTNKPVKGGQGANIYQILPSYDLDVQAQMSKRKNAEIPHDSEFKEENSENQSAISLSSKSFKEFNTYTAPETDSDTYFSAPYRSVIKTVFQYVEDKKLASKMYGIYLAQIKHIKGQYSQDTLLDITLSAIRTSFIATKNKAIKSITGYFNGILNNKLDELYYQTLESMDEGNYNSPKQLNGPIFYDWLN
ncbi:hypothetical protein B5V89_06815 [Heyndrickxia sporothermodurans]|uniref:helix-turn-helix domain-containing protein n=1 Tax=Heyndrickxia sporothermodurans TaxID=46224 RepID=UPI000D378264|nr:helix-turn-helix domain-containing protein [Heyndrickxia sporothermodurans]PTY79045.1 hypothetical protein B5V89_06815 [Heyndrickxia sporothermodurans]